MSRVERTERNGQSDTTERRSQPVDQRPSQAEGDEVTVNQALRNQEGRESRRGKREEPR